MKRSGSCQDLRRLVLLCVAAAAIAVFVSSMPPPLDRSAESQSAGHHSQDGSAANYSPGQGLAVTVPAVPATIAWGFDPVQGELLDAAVDLLQQGHQADGHAPLFDPDDVLELHVLWTLDNRPIWAAKLGANLEKQCPELMQANDHLMYDAIQVIVDDMKVKVKYDFQVTKHYEHCELRPKPSPESRGLVKSSMRTGLAAGHKSQVLCVRVWNKQADRLSALALHPVSSLSCDPRSCVRRLCSHVR